MIQRCLAFRLYFPHALEAAWLQRDAGGVDQIAILG
jgi:hypothetical protein